MKRLAIVTGIALAFLLTVAEMTFAKDRVAIIHMTQNYSGTQPAECVGTVATEVIPSKRNDQVTWIIRNGNSENDDDVCLGVDKSMVSLHFKDDVMGAAAMRVLSAAQIMYKGKTVWAIQGNIDSGVPANTAHGYMVFYKGKQAGPDPEIEVECPSCGGK